MKKYFSLLLSFLKIGLIGFGGGSALIPIIEEEIVTRKKMLKEEDYNDHVIVSNITPGTLPVKLAAAAGKEICGTNLYKENTMENVPADKLKNNSESFFIIPFYYSGKKEFEKCISENWKKDQSYNHWFLAKHIDAFDKGEGQIFTYYTLAPETYQSYGLPKPNEKIKVLSDLIMDDGYIMPEQFTVKIYQIKILYFNTGFGFIIYKADHEDDTVDTVINKSFALLRAFVSNRKSGKQVRFFVPGVSENGSNESEDKEINIVDITNRLLELKGRRNKTELFPISCKNQCYVYHRIQLAEPLAEEEVMRDLLLLRKGFHGSFIAHEEDENSIYDFVWKQNKNLYWGGSMKGLVSLSFCMPGENNYFVTKPYVNNVRNHYFLLYIYDIAASAAGVAVL